MAATLLGQVRELLGLTQLELAIHLRVARDLLAHAEGGRRNLPLEAMQRLLPLVEQLFGLTGLAKAEPPVDASETQPPPLSDQDPGRWRLVVCRHEAVNARYQRTLLHRKAQPLRRRIGVLTPLLAALPPAPADGSPDPEARDRRWYTDRLADARDKLTRCGALPQALLEARIQALDLEIGALEKLFAEGRA
ncbi:helix-turn-helix transcriptional regulator [Hymenobacter algoricola]|uniref:XRE family transcriptional regulator n=1 Tax=Hymenobacter algoricola TaxID=486267 RepID=A0ABP7MNT7_9BACT